MSLGINFENLNFHFHNLHCSWLPELEPNSYAALHWSGMAYHAWYLPHLVSQAQLDSSPLDRLPSRGVVRIPLQPNL